MEKHTVSRLFGSPPGYVGYDEGGQLTEKVRRKPFSVVLFDEVEKAHPDIFNSLLQILEDGRLTDAQGRVVDFKNTVIIMTTNLGTRDISKGFNMGFSKEHDAQGNYERMKAKVNEELKQHFRPEFLNRVDDTIVFHQLTEDEIVTIVDLMIAKVDLRLRDRDMGLELTSDAKKVLAKKGYDPVLGARPLRRTIQREIEDVLSEKILFGELKAGQIVVVDAEGVDTPEAAFTFRGEAKPALVPDLPPLAEAAPAADPAGAAGDRTSRRVTLDPLGRYPLRCRPSPHRLRTVWRQIRCEVRAAVGSGRAGVARLGRRPPSRPALDRAGRRRARPRVAGRGERARTAPAVPRAPRPRACRSVPS